jgi:hypothetical protein
MSPLWRVADDGPRRWIAATVATLLPSSTCDNACCNHTHTGSNWLDPVNLNTRVTVKQNLMYNWPTIRNRRSVFNLIYNRPTKQNRRSVFNLIYNRPTNRNRRSVFSLIYNRPTNQNRRAVFTLIYTRSNNGNRQLAHSVTTWSRVLLEKLTVTHLVDGSLPCSQEPDTGPYHELNVWRFCNISVFTVRSCYGPPPRSVSKLKNHPLSPVINC